MSEHHAWSRAPGEKSRHSRSGSLGLLLAGVVVRLGHRGADPDDPVDSHEPGDARDVHMVAS